MLFLYRFFPLNHHPSNCFAFWLTFAIHFFRALIRSSIFFHWHSLSTLNFAHGTSSLLHLRFSPSWRTFIYWFPIWRPTITILTQQSRANFFLCEILCALNVSRTAALSLGKNIPRVVNIQHIVSLTS